jgi:hypothetical protein
MTVKSKEIKYCLALFLDVNRFKDWEHRGHRILYKNFANVSKSIFIHYIHHLINSFGLLNGQAY